MIEVIFTFIITFLILSVCWFVPKAGTASFQGATKQECIVIGAISLIPAIILAILS